jgi:hypothetical protein
MGKEKKRKGNPGPCRRKKGRALAISPRAWVHAVVAQDKVVYGRLIDPCLETWLWMLLAAVDAVVLGRREYFKVVQDSPCSFDIQKGRPR